MKFKPFTEMQENIKKDNDHVSHIRKSCIRVYSMYTYMYIYTYHNFGVSNADKGGVWAK